MTTRWHNNRKEIHTWMERVNKLPFEKVHRPRYNLQIGKFVYCTNQFALFCLLILFKNVDSIVFRQFYFWKTTTSLKYSHQGILIHCLVTSLSKLMYFCNNYCPLTINARILKIVAKESKLIYAINNFIVASWFLMFLCDNHSNTMKNKNHTFWWRSR